MPFDPTKPAPNSPIVSAELRDQFNSLNADIQSRATPSQVLDAQATAIASSSNNSNGVGTLDFGISDPPTQSEVQTMLDKINELINALRR